jgi:polyferredoxin
MGKLGKESLVQWSSINKVVEGKPTKMLRSKTYMYAGALIAIFFMLFVMGSKKEYMLLNVNRGTQLYKTYKTKTGFRVINNYTLLFQNTEPKKHTYKLEVIGEYAGKVEIKRFDSVTLSPGKKAKKIMRLSTTERLVDDATKDTPLTIMVKAYAVDEPERIIILRKMTFFYPRSDLLK